MLANAKALVFAGTFFFGDEPERWRRAGLRLLARELPEQILADGGHFERSPMYHSAILEDVLDLVNLAGIFPDAISEKLCGEWRTSAQKMRVWLAVMCHPDGEIALFNDAALNIVPQPVEIENYARRLGLGEFPSPRDGITLLRESGYARLQKDEAVLIVDVAPIGPDYLPGHAHADTLTFELSLFGSRIIVDSGTSTYDNTSERHAQRSTAAHNTVEVDGENSSEMWGSFRVARRAKPHDLKIDPRRDTLRMSCSHDGFRRLPGKVTHSREWRLRERELEITDTLIGKFGCAVSRFHFHPSVASDKAALAGTHDFSFANHRLAWRCGEAAGKVMPSHYHPEFGIAHANICLFVHQETAEARHHFSWT